MSFFKDTVDSILKEFHVKLDRLKILAEEKAKEIDEHTNIIADFEKARAEVIAEKEKAHALIDNFEKLLGLKPTN